MATPTPLVRLDGTVIGHRVVEIPARPADPATGYDGAEAYAYGEIDVQVPFSRYDGDLVPIPSVQAVVTEAEHGPPPVGTTVAWLVQPYSTARRTRTGFFRYAALRLVGDVPQLTSSAAPARASA